MKRALSVDIGGTKISAALVDKKGNIVSNIATQKTPKTKSEIERVLKTVIKNFEFDIMTIATAGAVNLDNTAVISSTGNLCKDYRTIKFLKLTQKPVLVENDANCAAWAEYKVGSAIGCRNSVILTLGTGVGGGIIIDGRLLKGKSGAAGEMHFKMRTDTHRKCTCGAFDCFEAYASGTGMKRTGEEISGNSEITTYDVIKGYERGDEVCVKILETWRKDVTMGLIGLANIFDPDCIVLSGSMAKFVDYTQTEKVVNAEIVTTATKVYPAQLENNAGLVGAALLGFEFL